MSQGPILPQNQYPQHIIVPSHVDVDTKYSKNYTIPAAIVLFVIFALSGLLYLFVKTLMHDRERVYNIERKTDELSNRLILTEEKTSFMRREIQELQREFDRHKVSYSGNVILTSRGKENWGTKWTYLSLVNELGIVIRIKITQMITRMNEVFKEVFSYVGIEGQNLQIGKK